MGQNDRRALIRLVERWSETGEPTRRAHLLQARALIDLCLMDRAWVRLNEVLQQHEDDVETMLLAAEMFVERGWPVRARKLLRRARELKVDPERLVELERRASEPPLQPATRSREVEQTGTPEEQLALAERFQATGSFLRAKSILERLRRNHAGTWDSRVDDLLWALSGDFAKEDGDPMELARSLVPGLSEPPDEPAEYTESVRASEVTSVGNSELDGDLEDDDDGPAFPALFRRLDQTQDTETASEVTAVSLMADRDEMVRRMLKAEDAEFDDDDFDDDDEVMGQPGARGGDTQIMLVVRKDGRASDQHHRRKAEEYSLRETLNLREYQSEMGMEAPPPTEDEVRMEEEDDDLIVVTRREGKAPEPQPQDEPAVGAVQVVERSIVPLTPPPPAIQAPPPAARSA
ncbi:MAG: hypothetical protein KDA24_30130, partial [Deltaproteobacteria bacterium]|nr:hypothetical protein [Deltaproteobacteria bacterium]